MSDTNLGFKAGLVSKENLLGSLRSLTDDDFNGNNGNDYTSKIAINKGFESDLEFHLDDAARTHGDDLEKIINHVIPENYKQKYYKDYQYDSLLLDNGDVYVAVSYIS